MRWLVGIALSISVLSPVGLPAQSWVSPSGCIWATAPALSGASISRNDLRECVQGLIEAIQKNRDEIGNLKIGISHEEVMRGYLKSEIADMEATLEDIQQKLQTLTYEITNLRTKLQARPSSQPAPSKQQKPR